MSKLLLNNLSNLQNEITAVSTINTNNDATEAALENTLSRDGSTPNIMNAQLDMNSNRIINLPDAINEQEPATLGQLQEATSATGLSASFLTLGPDVLLANERVLTAGNNLSIADGGANNAATISISSSELNALATTTSAADKVPYYTGVGTANTATMTSFARTVLDDADAATARTTLGVTPGTDVQAYDADLTAVAGLATTGLIARTGAGTASTRTVTGTANEITVTNGDGVSGNPTVSIPAAVTLTGKTVTGGTFASPTLTTPALGTPASGTLTNTTGLPISTGVSGLGTGVATFLATPTSANLRTALTDEVGTGAAYFVGGALGTPASGTLTNATGLPLTTGVTGNLPLSSLAAQGAYTIVANATGSTAVPTAMDVTALTSKPSPVSGDIVLIQDSAASNAFKKTTVGALSSAGSVASYNTRTGAVTATENDVPLRNYLTGLTLSAAGSTATFGIAIGVATDSTNVSMMKLSSAYTKTTSAWALGTAAGAMDTGTVAASTWYHVYLIQRPDTGVVDVTFSLNATTPTLPTNYTLYRRIGSMKTDGSSQWVRFIQDGDDFLWGTSSADISAVNPGTSAVTRTLNVPTGVTVKVRMVLSLINSDVSVAYVYVSDLNASDEVPGTGPTQLGQTANFNGSNILSAGEIYIRTNTSGQVRSRVSYSSANVTIIIKTIGWTDTRGK